MKQVEGGCGVETDRVVMVALSADALNFLKLAHGGRGLDVLEGDLLVLAEVDNATEVEVQALCGAVLLEKIDDSGGPKEIGVLLGDVDHSLEVLADVHLEHFVETLHREVDREAAEVVCEELLL